FFPSLWRIACLVTAAAQAASGVNLSYYTTPAMMNHPQSALQQLHGNTMLTLMSPLSLSLSLSLSLYLSPHTHTHTHTHTYQFTPLRHVRMITFHTSDKATEVFLLLLLLLL